MRAQRVLQIDPGLLRGLCCFTVCDRTGEAVRRAGASSIPFRYFRLIFVKIYLWIICGNDFCDLFYFIYLAISFILYIYYIALKGYV